MKLSEKADEVQLAVTEYVIRHRNFAWWSKVRRLRIRSRLIYRLSFAYDPSSVHIRPGRGARRRNVVDYVGSIPWLGTDKHTLRLVRQHYLYEQ